MSILLENGVSFDILGMFGKMTPLKIALSNGKDVC